MKTKTLAPLLDTKKAGTTGGSPAKDPPAVGTNSYVGALVSPQMAFRIVEESDYNTGSATNTNEAQMFEEQTEAGIRKRQHDTAETEATRAENETEMKGTRDATGNSKGGTRIVTCVLIDAFIIFCCY